MTFLGWEVELPGAHTWWWPVKLQVAGRKLNNNRPERGLGQAALPTLKLYDSEAKVKETTR